MGKEQEYLYNSEYVTIAHDIVGEPELCVVVNDHEELIVARRKNLQKKEDSWGYKRAQERSDELKQITADAEGKLDELVEKVIEKAVSALSTRMKLNAVFGKDMGNAGGWAVMVADELNKLVKEEAPDIIKKKELPF